MKPWELIDSTTVPGSGATMRLMRHGRNLVILVENRELMRDKVHASEAALAELTCERLVGSRRARLLIGGLGVGGTLAAALRGVGAAAKVIVAELVPAVVRWNHGLLGEATGHPLSDPRVSVYEGDVADLIRRPPAPWDAILLDVDNGPEGLTRQANNELYTLQGLEKAFHALRPGGLLSVWSAAPDRAFDRRLEQAGFAVQVFRVRARGQRGGRRHLVWVARRPA